MAKRTLDNDNEEDYGMEVVDYKPSFYKILLKGLQNQILQIPAEFLKQISSNLSDRAILKTPSCRSWSVKVIQSPNGACITDGWQDFLKDNSLGNNEFLLFTSDGDMNFKVRIFDTSGCEINYSPSIEMLDLTVSPTRLKTSVNYCSGALKAIESFDSKLPHCKCSVRSYSMTLPKTFSEVHLSRRRMNMVLRNLEGKKWVVKCFPNSKGSQLRQGWTAFRKGNNLKVGDLCIFEIVGKQEMFVHAFPIGQNTYSEPRIKRGRPRKNQPDHTVHVPRKMFSEDCAGDLKQVESFSTGFPHFTCFVSGFKIAIPRSISKGHLPEKKSIKIALRNWEGKEWPVNVFMDCRGSLYMCGGWADFRHANKIEQGDTCIFELVDKQLFQVHVLGKGLAK